MSSSPTSRSAVLARLVEEGHEVEIVGGALFVRRVPYVSSPGVVDEGTLVVDLGIAAPNRQALDRHGARWIGLPPLSADGRPLPVISAEATSQAARGGAGPLVWLCAVPPGREFADHHELVTAYVSLLGAHAEAVRPGATARFGAPRLVLRRNPADDAVRGDGSRSPFHFADPAPSRAGVDGLAQRFAGTSVGIVGLGGTGSHVLDLVAKTPVERIVLFDDDVFEPHSAFRAPGAASPADVSAGRSKALHHATVHSVMRRGVVAHQVRLEPSTTGLLDDLDFCFVCVDDSGVKDPILDHLVARSIPWIDVGMGLRLDAGGIVGALRTTIGRPGSFVDARLRVPKGSAATDPYASNLQTVELNALNAALAVVEWKRMAGFYGTGEPALNSVLLLSDGEIHVERRTEGVPESTCRTAKE